MSLVKQKRIQWAKEREEISRLNELFASTTTTQQIERTSIRTYYSNVDLISKYNSDTVLSQKNQHNKNQFVDNKFYQQNDIYSSDDGTFKERVRIRSPSLPPISRNKMRTQQIPISQYLPSSQTQTDEETSGYLSDKQASPNVWKSRSERGLSRMRLPTEKHKIKTLQFPLNNQNFPDLNYLYADSDEPYKKYNVNGSVDSSQRKPNTKANNTATPVSNNETRTKFVLNAEQTNNIGDGQGRKLSPNENGIDDNEHETDFSIPKTASSSSSEESKYYSRISSRQNMNYCTKEQRAKWCDRNISLKPFYDSVAKEDGIKSGPCWLERAFPDSGDESVRSYSFIRGQNTPIDANTLAERTSKRLKAIEFQNAIKEQLDTREENKRLEHERILLEERKREDCARQQLEAEQLRSEKKQREQQERIDIELKKQKVMQAAIEKARQEAEVERARKKRENHKILNTVKLVDAGENIKQNDALVEPKTKISESITKSVESNISLLEANTEIQSLLNVTDSNATNLADDEEQVLIGTPIKMKKKALSNLKKSSAAESTDIDGIALVLQTVPPILPISSNDLLNLSQNLTNLNNIQLAVILAQQMQQLNSMTQNQQSDNELFKGQNVNEIIRQPIITEKGNNIAAKMEYQNENEYTDISTSIRTQAEPAIKQNENDEATCNRCNICGKKQKAKLIASTDEIKSNQLSPAHGKQTSNILQMKDTVTFTNDIADITATIKQIDIGVKTYIGPNSSAVNIPYADAATQTEDKPITDCCFQFHYHPHPCSHHNYIIDDPTISNIKHLASLDKCNDRECSISTAAMKKNLSENLKTIEIKEIREPIKLEDRPKWGVNRPIIQYVKASERDPIYLRNKRKRSENKFSYTENGLTIARRSISPSLSIKTNSTVTLSSPSSLFARNAMLKRNICTEILPIKTDVNGRVYLNFREASITMSENEMKQNVRNCYNKVDRIINRNRTIDDALNDGYSTRSELMQSAEQANQPDIDTKIL